MWKGCRSRSVVDRVGRGQSNEARRTRSRNPFWYSQSNLKVYHSSWPCSDTLKWRDRKGGENYDLVPLECLSHIRTMFSLGAVQCACLIGHMGSFCQPSWFCHRDSMGRAPIQSHSWKEEWSRDTKSENFPVCRISRAKTFQTERVNRFRDKNPPKKRK